MRLIIYLIMLSSWTGQAIATDVQYVANNTALKVLATPPPATIVFRASFASDGDGGAMHYRYSGSACTISSGAGDDGAEVRPNSGSGCWVAIMTGEANARVWGAVGTTTAPYDTATLQNALNWACPAGTPRSLLIPSGIYYHSGLTIAGSCNIRGEGRASTIVSQTNTTASDISVNGSGSQKVTISDLYFRPTVTKTAGYAVEFHEAYLPTLERVDIAGFNGILDDSSASMILTDVNFDNLTGTVGINLIGKSEAKSVFGAILDNVIATAPSNSNIVWVLMDSFSYSVTIKSAVLLYGGKCLVMRDSVNSSMSISRPKWLFVSHVECDHNYSAAIHLIAGQNATISPGSWVGSSQTSAGIATEATWKGGLTVTGVRINGNALWGLAISGGTDTKIVDNEITANGQGIGGTHYDQVFLASGISNVKISGNHISNTAHDNSSTDRYCINVAGGTGDHILINGNTVNSCSSGSIFVGATGTQVKVVDNDGYNY